MRARDKEERVEAVRETRLWIVVDPFLPRIVDDTHRSLRLLTHQQRVGAPRCIQQQPSVPSAESPV
jgi:hypothetical protein